MANEVARMPAMTAAPAGHPFSVMARASSSGNAHDHDDNGNRTGSGWEDAAGLGFRFRYIYDAWNRLVRIDRATKAAAGGEPTAGNFAPIALYTYNGLNWRTSKRTVGPTLAVDSSGLPILLEKRTFYHDAAWRAVAEEIDDDTTNATGVAGTDRRVQQFFGLQGVNNAIYRREDRATYVPATYDPGRAIRLRRPTPTRRTAPTRPRSTNWPTRRGA